MNRSRAHRIVGNRHLFFDGDKSVHDADSRTENGRSKNKSNGTFY